jgi:hypothetical protein
MAEAKRIDGRHITTEAAEILTKLHDELPGLAGKLDAAKIPVWQEKIKALVDDVPIIMEKLFLKTQGGTHMAQLALEKVKALEEAVKQGIQGLSAAEATEKVDKAMEEMAEDLGALIEKTKSHIIRMT